MLNVLVQGKLANDPQTRTAANGNPYVTASAAVDTPNGSILCGLIAFAHAADRLAVLHKGDAIAASGEGKLTSWEKNGEQHNGLSVTVAEVLTVYVARQRRNGAAAREQDHADDAA